MQQVKARLDHIQNDLLNNFHRLGVQAKPLNGVQRLKLMLMMLYNTGSRLGLMQELRIMQCYLKPDETALRELSEGVIEKLKLMTDAQFAEVEFPMD